MILAGEKLIKINITIPRYGDMMDTYDYARECVRQLKGGTHIPDMKLFWSVERVEDSKENNQMLTDEVPVPFIETDEYIEIAVGDDKLGFLSTSNGRWRIYKDYLVKQMRRGCYKMLSAREDFPKVQDPQELVDKTEKIILIAFDRQIEAFLTLRTAGRKFKGVELMDRLITNFISVTLQTALVRETARISNLLGDMYDKYPETGEPTDDDWKETLEKIEKGTPSSCYSASGYSTAIVNIPADMYDILKEYYRHRANKEPTAEGIDGLTESILSDFINALEGMFSSPKLREMYDKYLSKHGK